MKVFCDEKIGGEKKPSFPQMEFGEEERGETFPPTGEIPEPFDAELLQQISCEAFVSQAAHRSPHPGPSPGTKQQRSIIYEHLTAAA